MTPVATNNPRIPLKEADVELLRSIVKAATQIITSEETAIKHLQPYAAHIIRISLGELRRHERALKTAAANTKPAKK